MVTGEQSDGADLWLTTGNAARADDPVERGAVVLGRGVGELCLERALYRANEPLAVVGVGMGCLRRYENSDCETEGIRWGSGSPRCGR